MIRIRLHRNDSQPCRLGGKANVPSVQANIFAERHSGDIAGQIGIPRAAFPGCASPIARYLERMNTSPTSSARAMNSERSGEIVQDWILLGLLSQDGPKHPVLLNGLSHSDERIKLFCGTRTEAYSEADSQARAWQQRGGSHIDMLRIIPANLGLVVQAIAASNVEQREGIAA